MEPPFDEKKVMSVKCVSCGKGSAEPAALLGGVFIWACSSACSSTCSEGAQLERMTRQALENLRAEHDKLRAELDAKNAPVLGSDLMPSVRAPADALIAVLKPGQSVIVMRVGEAQHGAMCELLELEQLPAGVVYAITTVEAAAAGGEEEATLFVGADVAEAIDKAHSYLAGKNGTRAAETA